jgi:hypothetical protein
MWELTAESMAQVAVEFSDRAELMWELTAESMAQAVVESTAQAVLESTVQVVVESTAQAVLESTAQAVVESTAQAAVESTAQAVVESTAQVAAEFTCQVSAAAFTLRERLPVEQELPLAQAIHLTVATGALLVAGLVDQLTVSLEWVAITTISNLNKCKCKWACKVRPWPDTLVFREMPKLTRWVIRDFRPII